MSVGIQNTLQCLSVGLLPHRVSYDSQFDPIAHEKLKYLGLKSCSGIISVDKFVRFDVLESILFVLKSGEGQSHRYRKEVKKDAIKYTTKENVYRSIHTIYIGRDLAKHIEEQQNGDCNGLFALQRNVLPQISS
jgi:hypothetical protein